MCIGIVNVVSLCYSGVRPWKQQFVLTNNVSAEVGYFLVQRSDPLKALAIVLTGMTAPPCCAKC